MIRDFKSWNIAAAKLGSFTSFSFEEIDEDLVMQYHAIVALFEKAIGGDLSTFKIPNERLEERPKFDVDLGTIIGKEKTCNKSFFFRQIGALARYVKAQRDQHNEYVGDREYQRKTVNNIKPVEARGPNYTINVETMHNSALMAGSPGAVIKNNFNAKSTEFAALIKDIRNAIPKLNLEKSKSEQMYADVETIEVQIGSPAPKYMVISESVSSIRSIVEGIAANVITSGLLLTLNQFFPK